MSRLPPEPADADNGYPESARTARARHDLADTADGDPRIECWRCEKSVVPRLGRCPYCHARLETPPEERIVLQVHGLSPLFKVLFLLGALMVVSLITHRVARTQQMGRWLEADWQNPQWRAIVIGEAVSSGLVMLGLLWIRRLPRASRPQPTWRLVAWFWSVPVLGILLGLNLGYHWLIRKYLDLPFMRLDLPVNAATLLVICLQPAVIEELCFRYLALNSLRVHMGLHAAVLVSSVMFGLAHIGVFFSIPLLIVLGVGLGYARVVSGGLALPMLMHFAHNALILYLNNVL